MSSDPCTRSMILACAIACAGTLLSGCPTLNRPSARHDPASVDAVTTLIAERVGNGETISPAYKKVLAAMLAIEYWANNDYTSDSPMWDILASPKDAAEVLKSDASFGANT